LLLTRQLCGALYFRAEKREQEAKHRGAAAAAADSQMKPSSSAAAAASSDSQGQLHELKKRNDELEDEVSSVDVLFKFWTGLHCFDAVACEKGSAATIPEEFTFGNWPNLKRFQKVDF